MLDLITKEHVYDTWDACYPKERVAELFSTPLTPLQILTKQDGIWSDVPPEDRFWAVLRSEVLPDELMRLFACWCAEQSLDLFESKYPDDKRPRRAVEATRLFVAGKRGKEELRAADAAADAAAYAAADAAAAAAYAAAANAYAAAYAATYAADAAAYAAADAAAAAAYAAAANAYAAAYAATYAADAAAYAAADAAAYAATYAADARFNQLTKLIEMVTIWKGTGDIYGGEQPQQQGDK